MTGCKYSLRKIPSAVAALALLLPTMALGEFGVCPPYSKTFGPEDLAEINTFLVDINSRPGGGTVILEPGSYYGLGEGVSIVSVICIRRGDGPGDAPDPLIGGLSEWLTVATSGMLTVVQVQVRSAILVEEGATLFADRAVLSGAHDANLDDARPSLRVAAGGFAHLSSSTIDAAENSGMFIMKDGSIDGAQHWDGDDNYGPERGSPGLSNDGYAFLDQVLVQHVQPAFKFAGDPSGVDNAGVMTIVGTTVSDNGGCEWYSDTCGGLGIRNAGYLEMSRSIVANNYFEECAGPILDLGYNVFEPGGGCVVTETTSIEADPLLDDDQELMAGSPAIDRVPLGLCSDTDGLGRARTDGNSDGIVACDAGALEYGYGFIEATVRARPYHWREVGTIDLSTTDLMTIYVYSTATFDATRILFETVAIEGFEQDARGWPWNLDVGKDGVMDYQITWWLNRQPPLPCGYQEHEFTAMTEDGQQVTGRLKFEAVGCTG